MLLDGNSNYFGAISPTGRNIQGVVPNKRYFVLPNFFNTGNNGDTILKCPIPYRRTLSGGIQQDVTIILRKDSQGNVNLYLDNLTNNTVKYCCNVMQLLNGTTTGLYKQVGTSVLSIEPNAETTSPLIELSAIGATSNGNTGNDSGHLDLSLLIDDLTINAIIEWHTPIKALNADGWLSLETIDKFTDSI